MKDILYENLEPVMNFNDGIITINDVDLRVWAITSDYCSMRADHIKREELIKIEGNCPSCGAPITGEKCEYCGRLHYLKI